MIRVYKTFVGSFTQYNTIILAIYHNILLSFLKSSRMNRVSSITRFFFLVLLLAVFVKEAQLANAATCDPNEMRVCMWAYTTSTAPSSSCCDMVRKHRSCYCQYKKNPTFQSYLQSPTTKKIISQCGITLPSC